MELWWFLEPLLKTSLIIALVGGFISWFIDKITNETGFTAPFIAFLSVIPCAISLILFLINFLFSILYNIWAPFL